MKSSIYDSPIFFERYLNLRQNPNSINEIIEKPTMFSLLPSLQGKRVLDLGCGAGGHLLHYAHLGASQVVGLDLSQAMIQQAELDFAKNLPKTTACQLYCLPIERLNEIEFAEFDVITSSFAFHYIDDFPAVLRQIYQKLVPNGYLIFSQEHPIVTCHLQGSRWEKDEHKQQIAYRLNHYRQEGMRERNWFKQSFKTYHRTIATILNQLISAGFEIERVDEPMLVDQQKWQDEFKDLLHRPPLLFIKSVKKS